MLTGFYLVAVAAAAPVTLHQQGRVTDGAGAPLDGVAPLTFELHTSEASTSAAWTETLSLPVQDGYYSARLGSTTALDSSFFAANPELWVAVRVGTSEVGRSKVSAVPFAVQATAATTINRTDCAIGDTLTWNGTAWACTAPVNPSVTTFVRWGRTVCPSGTTALYAGWVLSGRYTDAGATADYLCGTESPDYSPSGLTGDQNGHLLWGVEFEDGGHSRFNTLVQREARCVVCEVTGSHTLMIPTAASCPSTWTEQYQGVPAGTHYGQAQQTTTICVDDNAESWGDTTNHNHGLLYSAEIERNSGLPAAYLQDREPACVICTK